MFEHSEGVVCHGCAVVDTVRRIVCLWQMARVTWCTLAVGLLYGPLSAGS